MNPYLQDDIHQYISLNTYISKHRKVMDDYGENVGIQKWIGSYVKSKDISDAGMILRTLWVYGYRKEDGNIRQEYSGYKEYPLAPPSIFQYNIIAFRHKKTNEWYRSPIQRFRRIYQLRGGQMYKCNKPHYYYTYPKGLPDWVKTTKLKK